MQNIIQIDPEIQSGEPVFYNTRVPIRSLFDYVETGESLKTYLEDFPAVSEQQAIYVLKKSQSLLFQTYQFVYEENFA